MQLITNDAEALIAKLRAQIRPTESEMLTFYASEIKDGCYLAIDNTGSIAFLLNDPDRDEVMNRLLRSNVIDVHFYLDCTINVEGQETKDTFHVMRCISEKENLLISFTNLCFAFASYIKGKENKGHELHTFFLSLMELLSPVKVPTRDKQGLWAELFFINFILKSPLGFKYYQSEPKRLFDFSKSNIRMEIKSTISKRRTHKVKHRQLVPSSEDEQIYLGSFMLIKDDSGLSLRELIHLSERKLSKLSDGENYELLMRMKIAAREAGMTGDIEGPKFNKNHALRSFRVYKSEEAPQWPTENQTFQYEPDDVTDTEYNIHLDNRDSIDLKGEEGKNLISRLRI